MATRFSCNRYLGNRLLVAPRRGDHEPARQFPAKTIYRADYRRLVARLRERREQLGWAQADLAQRLGWPQQRVSAVEAGARRLDVIEFWQLTGVLGLSAPRLLALLHRKVTQARPPKV